MKRVEYILLLSNFYYYYIFFPKFVRLFLLALNVLFEVFGVTCGLLNIKINLSYTL